jgi:lipopolysaccharide export system protein LptA
MLSRIIAYLLPAVIAIVMIPGLITAQDGERITIERTDSLRSFVSEGLRVNRLIGNVRLRDRDRVFESDSAYHFPDLDRIEAWGNLRISGNNETIWADVLEYTADDDTGRLRGRVVIEQDSITLFSTTAVYDFTNEIARFPNQLELRDLKSILLADSGIFYNQNDSAVFVGNVQLADSSSYLEGDTLRYKRDIGSFWMSGEIFGENRSDSIRFRGAYVFGDSTGYKKVTGGSMIEKLSGSQPDTTYIHAGIVEYFRTGKSYRVDAYEDATVFNNNYSARADSILYVDSTSTVSIMGNARIWQDRLQLSAQKQLIFLTDSDVDSLFAEIRPFAVLEDSTTGRLHQLTGSMIVVRFDSSNVKQIDIPSQTELLYFPSNDQNQPDGAIMVRIGSMSIYFVDGELDQIFGIDAPDGEVYDEEPGVESMKLEGFQYEPELRPLRPLQRPEPRLTIPVRTDERFPHPPLYRRHLQQIKL